MHELKQAIKISRDTSPDIDTVHYQLVKHIPDDSMLLLLYIFDHIWLTQDFPILWKTAIIIPVPNPVRLLSDPGSVPHGSILSVTLFSLTINSIVSCLLPDSKCSLYVNYLAIYYSSSHMPSIEGKLPQSLNRLGLWCDKNGFKFSPINLCVSIFVNYGNNI